MNNHDKRLEFKVGLFVLVGLAVIGSMVVYFGRFGQQVKEYYSVTVELPNANGILQNSDVLLAGARVGFVADKPRIAENLRGVTVTLNIIDTIKVPKSSRFQVESSGLLGDRFVTITPPEDFDPATFNPRDPKQVLNDGEIVKGSRAAGLDDLAAQGQEAMRKLSSALDEVKKIATHVNKDVLAEENLQNLNQTFENLRKTSATFVEASANIKDVTKDMQGVVDSAHKTLNTAQDTLKSGKETVESAKEVIRRASQGEGLIPRLLNNREIADNLTALVSNLRRHGILFYKDSAARSQQERRRR